MNSCEFKDIIISEGFEIENGMLGLHRDVFLNVIKLLDSSILRNVWVNINFFFNFYTYVLYSILALVKNHTHEWNIFISWFID
jgi:hypothetical protein